MGKFGAPKRGNRPLLTLSNQAVSVALERAKETIYIADWWLSPELVCYSSLSDDEDKELTR